MLEDVGGAHLSGLSLRQPVTSDLWVGHLWPAGRYLPSALTNTPPPVISCTSKVNFMCPGVTQGQVELPPVSWHLLFLVVNDGHVGIRQSDL